MPDWRKFMKPTRQGTQLGLARKSGWPFFYDFFWKLAKEMLIFVTYFLLSWNTQIIISTLFRLINTYYHWRWQSLNTWSVLLHLMKTLLHWTSLWYLVKKRLNNYHNWSVCYGLVEIKWWTPNKNSCEFFWIFQRYWISFKETFVVDWNYHFLDLAIAHSAAWIQFRQC